MNETPHPSPSAFREARKLRITWCVLEVMAIVSFVAGATIASAHNVASGLCLTGGFIFWILSTIVGIAASKCQKEALHPPPRAVSCGQCGIDLKPGASQCHFCGWRLPAERQP